MTYPPQHERARFMGRWADAVKPPPRLRTSEWAERYRRLPRGSSPVPGNWRTATAPYLAWIMDAPDVPGIAQMNICKAAQIGVSEAFRNVIGARAHQDPEPIGLALPNRDKGEDIMQNRIHPLFTETAPLAELHSGAKRDLKRGTVRLPNGFVLHLMWAGSPASMASDPMRLAILDEVDKMSEWTGREADPISLTGKRLRAFGDRACQICISTPTTRTGKIWLLFESSPVRLYYHVPCPHCAAYIRLLFPRLHWQKQNDLAPHEHAAAVAGDPDATYYECQACAGHIHERSRWAMIQAGRWQPADGDPPILDAHGHHHDCAETVTAWPRRTRLGLQINAMYCLWTKWADIVAEHIAAVDLPSRYDFKCQTLGLPFDRQVARTSSNIYITKAGKATLPEGEAPEWTRKLIATVDTQKDHFYTVLRAWGANLRSARVWHSRLETFKELDEFLLTRTWPVKDQLPRQVDLILIDSGGTKHKEQAVSRTLQVYTWANQRRARVRPLKGVDKARSEQFMWWGRGYLDLGSKRKKRYRRPYLRLLRVVTNYWADLLADLITAGTVIAPDRAEQWFLNTRHDDEYNRHLASVAKVVVKRGAHIVEEWHPLTDGARIDYWDCEVYQVAAAYLLHLHNLIEATPEEDVDDLDIPPAPHKPPVQRHVASFYDG